MNNDGMNEWMMNGMNKMISNDRMDGMIEWIEWLNEWMKIWMMNDMEWMNEWMNRME